MLPEDYTIFSTDSYTLITKTEPLKRPLWQGNVQDGCNCNDNVRLSVSPAVLILSFHQGLCIPEKTGRVSIRAAECFEFAGLLGCPRT